MNATNPYGWGCGAPGSTNGYIYGSATPRAAQLSGIKIHQVKVFVYIFSALLATMSGMIMMGVSSFWQMVIKGVVIIVAVVIDLVQKDLQKKASLVARLK